MTNIFKLIFSKKTNQAKESVPTTFNIKETILPKVDFEVEEISYEEFQNAITKERRLKKRHPPINGGTKLGWMAISLDKLLVRLDNQPIAASW